LELDEPEEPETISLTDAITDPRAVVVVCSHTMVTVFAVLTSQRLFDVADGTVFVLDKKNYVFLLRLRSIRRPSDVVEIYFYLGLCLFMRIFLDLFLNNFDLSLLFNFPPV
jgi:hypothetical protein